MTPRQNLPENEFPPASSCGSVFVYAMPPENVMPVRAHPGFCTAA